jgi:DNA-binding transcriptional regulator GbsR (MarR family)
LSNHEELLTFIEELGMYYETRGFSRIAGRIMALLLVSDEALSAEQLSIKLRISLGSISTNMRLLINNGLVEKKSITGDRISYYLLSPNAFENEFTEILERLFELKSLITKGATFVNDNPNVYYRFQEMLYGIELYREMLEGMLSKFATHKHEN